jgi:hypothetical protein
MIHTLLDEVHNGLTQGHVGQALTYLCAGLHEARRQRTAAAWHELVETVCLPHPLTALMHEDPLLHAGYKAAQRRLPDFRFLDSIYYRHPVTAQPVTPLGRRLFDYSVNTPLCRAIRAQRRALARRIDTVAARVERPRVMALEPGYMRAAELSFALAEERLDRYVAVSRNSAALAFVDRIYGQHGVSTFCGSLAMASELQPAMRFDQLDLIYTPILFNLLSVQAAQSLLLRMWHVLRPGGELIITNFLADCPDTALFECYSGWHFHYRSLAEMAQLIQLIPHHKIDALDLTEDPQRVIGSLILRKG